MVAELEKTEPANWEARNRKLFGAVASTYGALEYLGLAARELSTEALRLPPASRAVDLACGTGDVAVALGAVADTVWGVDISPEMLDVARARARELPPEQRARLRWHAGSADALPFADGSVDLLTCGAGLMFMPDIAGALREWRRVLRPGGTLLLSSFASGLLGPLPGLWRAELAELDLRTAGPPLGRLGGTAAVHRLLREAGFGAVRVELRSLAFAYRNPEHRLRHIEAGLEGAALAALSSGNRAAALARHGECLRPVFGSQHLTVPVPLLLGWASRMGGLPERPDFPDAPSFTDALGLPSKTVRDAGQGGKNACLTLREP